MADSKLLDLLPPDWRRTELARGIANAFGRPFDQMRGTIGSLYRYFSPWAAPAPWLPWLAHVVALPPLGHLGERARRNLIAAAVASWRRRGTEPGIEEWLRAVAGVDADVVAPSVAFIAGLSKAGDVCGPGLEGYTFEVRVPASSGWSEAEIRKILEPVVLSTATYTVIFV